MIGPRSQTSTFFVTPSREGDTAFSNQLSAAGLPTASYDVKGVTGGGQVGYNWQFSPNWLWGLEADFNGSDIKGSTNTAFTFNATPGNLIATSQNVEWFGTVRARLGWLPADKLLVYGTGGFAYGSVRETASLTPNTNVGAGSGGIGFNCTANTTCFTGSSTKIATGYSAGGGLEYAAWQNITFKVEYLYVNLGPQASVRSSALVGIGPGFPALSSFTANFSNLDFNVVRVGANYRF